MRPKNLSHPPLDDIRLLPAAQVAVCARATRRRCGSDTKNARAGNADAWQPLIVVLLLQLLLDSAAAKTRHPRVTKGEARVRRNDISQQLQLAVPVTLYSGLARGDCRR